MITSLLLAATCGSVCGQSFVVKQRVVAPYAVQSYYAVPQINYFVGAAVRAESIVEHQKRSDPDWAEFQEFKRFKAYAQQQQRQEMHSQQAAPAPMPPHPALPESQMTIEATCAKCHGTQTPKGDFYVDGKPGMRAEDITKAIRMIAEDKMPKDRKLTRDEKNLLLMDLLRLEYQQQEPGAESLPPLPEPSGGGTQ